MERETYKYVLALKVAEPKWAVRFIAGTELLEDNNCRYGASSDTALFENHRSTICF